MTGTEAPGTRAPDPYGLRSRRRPSEATHLVNGVRAAVDAWRANGYAGASDTSLRLLQFWFEEDHRRTNGEPVRFFFCQREAVETFIYLSEISRVRSFSDLIGYATEPLMIDPAETRRQRLAVKMATGSGKTMAMSLCIAWSYFHARREADSPMSSSFLVLAPNVIVFERLKTDFADAVTFRRDPLVPPEWMEDFQLTVVLQDEVPPITTPGVLFLTNIQRLYEAPAGNDDGEPNPVEAMVGPRVTDRAVGAAEALFRQIADRGRVMVINDEAHHVWSEKLKWNQSIERLHATLREGSPADTGSGVVSQLDFSATPKDQKGRIFRHVVVDYPLADAVEDGIVKTPVIGELHGAAPELGDTAIQRYRRWIDAAVGRWRKFDEDLAPSGMRPALFVMCENTQAADEVGDYLRQLPDFAGDKLLVIHTNRSGEVSKADLDLARRAARDIDGDESPVRCIVSVLMLREGWDVRNVSVIVTLRSLSAKAKILPEQALGRGLRRMTPPGSGFDERVVVIEHEAFKDLWTKELDGGLVVEREEIDDIGPNAVAIFPDEGKRRYEISIPVLTRSLSLQEFPLERLEQASIAPPPSPLAVPDIEPDEYIRYRGRQLIDKGIIEEYEFEVPYAEDPSGVISYFTKRACEAGGLAGVSGAFAVLAPLVRTYLESRVFQNPVGLDDKVVLRRLAENDAQELVKQAFAEAIRALRLEEREATITETAIRMTETPPFSWSRAIVECERTVFNLTAVDNDLERRFALFLDRADDVAAFAKLPVFGRFALEYIAESGALRYYYPDFVLRLADDSCMIVETKGLRDPDVPFKDKRARRWCRDVSKLTGRGWSYLRVDQAVFDAFTGESVESLRRFVEARLGQPDDVVQEP
ncbi:MAG: DEAD/DEAH box helicase family protein [Actinobacteria bacterium]|nr:DEAD/DEAH box helicase family protein [Actinomycetota bacterium]